MTTRELAALLSRLEQHQGSVVYAEPDDRYELVDHTNCDYPPSQDNCRKGFEELQRSVGISAAASVPSPGCALAFERTASP